MFTHVKSTIRHIAPDNLRGRNLIKVVYVVLESQYQSALSQAVRTINAQHPHLAIEISGYLIEELRDPENYREFQTGYGKCEYIHCFSDFHRRLSTKSSCSGRTPSR